MKPMQLIAQIVVIGAALVVLGEPALADRQACLDNLAAGRVAHEDGDLRRAEQYLLTGIEIGAGDGDCLIDIYASLLAIYRLQFRTADEAAALERRLDLRTRILGADHPDLMFEAHDLGGLYMELGKSGKAASYLSRVLVFDIETFGEGSLIVADSRLFIAFLYEDAGEFDAAAQAYRSALAVYEQVLPADHPDLVRARARYATLRASIGPR